MSFQLPLLPEDYNVGPNDVIIGRGKKCTNNPGNLRFRGIVQTTLESYQTAETKVKKSEIIMDVLTLVREDDGAGFVKVDSASGRYIQVEEASCRIAIAQAFRDALSGAYKSSKKHKQMRRLERKRNSNPSVLLSADEASELEQAALEADADARRRPRFTPDMSAAAGISMFRLQSLLQEASNVNAVMDPTEATLAVAAYQNTQAMPGLLPLNRDMFSSLYSSLNNGGAGLGFASGGAQLHRNSLGFHQPQPQMSQMQMMNQMLNQQCHDPFETFVEPAPMSNSYAALMDPAGLPRFS